MPTDALGNLYLGSGDLAVDALGFLYNVFKGDGHLACFYLVVRP